MAANAVTTACAKNGQQPPNGYCNMELMLKTILRHGKVMPSGTCMDARALKDEELVDGAQRGDIATLSSATSSTDKVLVF